MKNAMNTLRRFLETSAWLMALGLTAVFAAGGFVMTAQLRAPEKIHYLFGGVAGHALSFVLMLCAVWGLSHAFRLNRKLACGLAVLWAAATAGFLLGAGTVQEVDFQYVCQAAEAFAAGDMSPMTKDYFHVYSYQLGTVFLLEGVLRLMPWADIGLMMQAVNAVLSICAAGMLAALGMLLFEDERVHASSLALYLTCLPFALYCMHVYGTLPMVFFGAAAMLSFVRCARTGKRRDGLMYVFCMALAYMIKPNSAVALLALMICAVLDGMRRRDFRMLGYAALSAVLAAALARAVLMLYEWRSGVTLREDVSMLARFVMGLQDGSRGAGWYNGYTEQFFGSAVTVAEEKRVAMADLAQRISQMAADPVRTVIFFVQKALSQWLEPTYGTMLYGNFCRQTGALAQAANAVFSEESALRMALEWLMKGWQLVLYAFAGVGITGNIRAKRGAAALMLPISVLGGFLYHMLFEAKSQYIYVYALYLIPLAGYGLWLTEDFVRAAIRRRKSRNG